MKLKKPLIFKKLRSSAPGDVDGEDEKFSQNGMSRDVEGRDRSIQYDLPDYVSRFIGSPWLEKLFPNLFVSCIHLVVFVAQMANFDLRNFELYTYN